MVRRHSFKKHCRHGHSVTISWDQADLGLEPVAPATLYDTPPVAPGVTWGIEQKCDQCDDIVRHAVLAMPIRN